MKNLPKKFFIAPNDAASKIKGSSIGGLGSYLAPGGCQNVNGRKMPDYDATVKNYTFSNMDTSLPSKYVACET